MFGGCLITKLMKRNWKTRLKVAIMDIQCRRTTIFVG